jgi:hypothetical protein
MEGSICMKREGEAATIVEKAGLTCLVIHGGLMRQVARWINIELLVGQLAM